MTEKQVLTGQRPLFETRRKEDKPLFMVLVVLSFLGAMMTLAVFGGLNASKHWQSTLDKNITVMVKPSADELSAQTRKALEIVEALPEVDRVTALPESYSKDLLRPWLGQAELPQDMPLPAILDVKLKPGKSLDTDRLKHAFEQAGIRADIDVHSHWAADIRHSLATVKLLALLSLTLVYAGIGAAAVFAAQAAINAHRLVINVLHQVGAPPATTARLLSSRLAIFGFKAALFGVLAALALALILRLVFSFGGTQSEMFLPVAHFSLKEIITILVSPVIFALLILALSWRTVLKTLNAEIYP